MILPVLPLVGLALGAGARFLPAFVARAVLPRAAVAAAAPVVAAEGAAVGASAVAAAAPVAASVGAKALAAGAAVGSAGLKGAFAVGGQAVKHPILTVGAVGLAHTATDGASTDILVKPVAHGVAKVAGSAASGALDAGKAVLLPETGAQAGPGEGGPLNMASGEASGAVDALSNLWGQYRGQMGRNGLYALPLLFGAMNFANGNGSMMSRAISAVVIGTVMGFMVHMAEGMGLKAPGIKGGFNMAANEDMKPLAAFVAPSPEKEARPASSWALAPAPLP